MSDWLEEAAVLETARDLIRWAASRFNEAELYFGHGTNNALDEAYALVLHCLHLPHELPADYLKARLTAGERAQILEMVRRRVEERQPLPYLTHESWFLGQPFYVDERVLIPRSPIAELIEARFEPFIEADSVTRVLDIGCGSACIAIGCAWAFPQAEVDAADISEDALQVAHINVDRHDLEGQVYPMLSDVYEGLGDSRYDIIVSNPPYVDAEDMSVLPQEYHVEPELALAAGDDGLDIVRRILEGAAEHLNPGGILICEVGNSEPAVNDAWPDLPIIWLEFERGGTGVFLVKYEDLRVWRANIEPSM